MKNFLLALFASLISLTAPALAASATNNDIFAACKNAPTSSICLDRANTPTTNPVNHLIHVAADLVAVVTGAVAVIMIIISGFKFVTGGANQQSVVEARNTLLWAVVGLVVVGLSWTIINFAVNKLIP